MGTRFSIVSLILIICGSGIRSGALAANDCQSIQAKLAAGVRASREDADAVNLELVADQSNPYKRIVAGEVLASLGLFSLANEQFEAADRLQNDYVLHNFQKVMDSNHFIPAVLFLYVQDKHPNNPALLLYSARRNLAVPAISKEQKDRALSAARKELSQAANLADPWPGTLSTLAMLEYNEGALLPAGSEKVQRLDAAIKYANRELEKHADDILARKIKILAYCRQGKNPWDLVQALQEALKLAPTDAELNLLLGRAYIYKGDYKSALRPALSGLLQQVDPSSLSEARDEVYTLICKVDRKYLVKVVNDDLGGVLERGTSGQLFRATLMRMRLAELFSLAGDRQEACRQLTIALSMHRHFRAAVAYKLGCELALMHEYFKAYPYIDLACRLTQNSDDAARYAGFRNRIARIGTNSWRDFALMIKTKKSFSKLTEPGAN